MAAQERGVYQPQEDFASYEDYPEEEGRSRLPLMIVIALVVVAAFGGVVWLAYNQGVQHGRAGAPPIVAAPAGPARTPPDETQTASGNPSTPYTGLKIYGEPIPPDEEAAGSALAPSTSPDVTTAVQTAAAGSSEPTTRLAPEVVVTPAPAPAPTPAPVQAMPEVVVTPAPAPAPVQATPRAPAPSPSAHTQAPAIDLTPAPAPAPPPAQVAAAPAPQPVHTGGGAALSGNAVLQIGSFPSEALANAAWKNFQRAHAGAVSGLSSDVVTVQIPGKGTWYRLRIGPFSDRGVAGTKCAQLKAQGATCLVAAP